MWRPKKLIEVALPLDQINKACIREKSIRHGHPATIHLWWARRPLAAARAVIFAQMADDPSEHPELFPTEGEQERERHRLFDIISEMVQWENVADDAILRKARDEIKKSWTFACAKNANDMRAAELFDPERLPGFYDPFAGGGSLALEAQRLGLDAHASDLNPVAVLINKAIIEIPTRFAKMRPINPRTRGKSELLERVWQGSQGLAEDVRFYGEWMRNEAEKRIGHLYPKVQITDELAAGRPDLVPLVGRHLTVISWIWARTVKSPNPAFANVAVPLASTFMLSTKPGKEAYVEPVIEGGGYHFTVRMGKPRDPESTKNGTKLARGANFKCLMSDAPMNPAYIYGEASAGRMHARLMAIVAETEHGRVYLRPTEEMEAIAKAACPNWKPDVAIPENPRWFSPPLYGLRTYGDLFTPRQLVALTTFSDLVTEAREIIKRDAIAAGVPDDDRTFDRGGIGADAYTAAILVYLALAVSKMADAQTSLCRWKTSMDQSIATFGRQALPMVWDYSEANAMGGMAGDYLVSLKSMLRALERLDQAGKGTALQADAQLPHASAYRIISTDPPYYDNIGYADLSDFFYIWLRRSLHAIFPELFATIVVPKDAELVATPYRHGSKDLAEQFFLSGMSVAMKHIADTSHPAFPVTIYYAFKQSETDAEDGRASTGWETFLEALINAGFELTGTWPMRTELANRIVGKEVNTLASSIVLACRRKLTESPVSTRREFLNELKRELPLALARMQQENIAPVDLAQAAIGPGMGIFTRYSKVLDAEGRPLAVRDALALINKVLDEILAEQESDFDAETRFAISWYEQAGFDDGDFGVADVLARAKNVSVARLTEAGIATSRGGKMRLLKPGELEPQWDPSRQPRVTTWEIVHHLVRKLEAEGEAGAAALKADIGSKSEIARELAYRLYTVAERRKQTSEALFYNGLVQSWPEITRLSRNGRATIDQTNLFGEQ